MNDKALDEFYREHLEEDIVFCLAERRKISPDAAMHLYYSSKLCDRIHDGEYGIQYLDYHVLTEFLEEELLSGEYTVTDKIGNQISY